jgi:DNA polymerase V
MPVFALADANSFFCSCERLIDPSLKGKPVIVLSNNDGVVVSRTKEAKALGISWDPLFKIRGLIEHHDVKCFSSNYALYKEMSGRVMQTLSEFTPKLEHYSIDEAFLNLEGIPNRATYVREIRSTVLQWTGIPVSIGVGATRTLAKIANRIAKHSDKAAGVLDLTQSPYLDIALKRVSVRDVWGIGRRCDVDDAFLIRRFNSAVLLRTVNELRGISCIPDIVPVMSKSLLSSLTFGRYVETFEELRQAVAMHTSQAAQKMRSEGLAAKGISVFIQTNPRREGPQYGNSAQIELLVPTDNSSELIKYAIEALLQIYREDYLYNKAGAVLYDLVPASEMQISLLNPYDAGRLDPLMRILDDINNRFGSGTLRYGAKGMTKSWRVQRNFLSDNGKASRTISNYQGMKPVCEFGMSLPVIKTMY